MGQQLTKNFNISEFAVSSSYPELAKSIYWSLHDQTKAYYLAKIILQPIRNVFGPIRITSGKRPHELNKAVGGSQTSDHLYEGYSAACDFTCLHATVEDVYYHIKATRHGSFGQLIHYKKSNFIHVSLPTEKHSSEAWEWDK